MQITIDTKNDSIEDIQKAIEILQQIAGKKQTNPVDEDNIPKQESFDMFGMGKAEDKSKALKPEREEKETDEPVQLIPY